MYKLQRNVITRYLYTCKTQHYSLYDIFIPYNTLHSVTICIFYLCTPIKEQQGRLLGYLEAVCNTVLFLLISPCGAHFEEHYFSFIFFILYFFSTLLCLGFYKCSTVSQLYYSQCIICLCMNYIKYASKDYRFTYVNVEQ